MCNFTRRASVFFLSILSYSVVAALPVTISTWNLNSDRRVEIDFESPMAKAAKGDGNGYVNRALPDFKIENRSERVIETIKALNSDVLFLQELDDTFVRLMKEALPSLGYQLVVARYSENKFSFSLITAFKPTIFSLSDKQQFYLSKTPEQSSNLGMKTRHIKN